jgi:hypothetical protein
VRGAKGGRGGAFDSQPVKCGLIFSFCFWLFFVSSLSLSFRFFYFILFFASHAAYFARSCFHVFICSYVHMFIFSKRITHEQCWFVQHDV